MAANVESMFYTRTAPWHGLGVRVEEVLGSKEALIQAGLDWKVEQTDVYAASGERIPGYKANIRDIDRSVLGIVGDRYKIVQNEEAFAFTDGLLGEGVKYETAGSLAGGKIVWMLAKLPEKYIISGDAIEPYLVFCNSHDGSGAIRVAMTPVRVVCQNTLNLALKGASRVWSARHTGNVMNRMDEARETLQLANAYMSQLGRSINKLQAKKLTDGKLKVRDSFFVSYISYDESGRVIKSLEIRNQRKEVVYQINMENKGSGQISQPEKTRPISDYRMKKLQDEMQRTGVTEQQIIARYHVSLANITEIDYKRIMNALKKTDSKVA